MRLLVSQLFCMIFIIYSYISHCRLFYSHTICFYRLQRLSFNYTLSIHILYAINKLNFIHIIHISLFKNISLFKYCLTKNSQDQYLIEQGGWCKISLDIGKDAYMCSVRIQKNIFNIHIFRASEKILFQMLMYLVLFLLFY